MYILLVEDQKDLAKNIKKYLELENNIQVDLAFDWEQGFIMFEKKHYDFLLVDWMLPKMSWIELSSIIRKTRDVPILMLTAKWQIEDKREWFWVWVDDYLVKPFDMDELVFRINAIYKRIEIQDKFKYWDLIVFFDKKVVIKSWIEVELTLKEFQILEMLVNNIWIAVSRTEIIDLIWWWDSVFESSQDWKLDVYISNLRKKLWKNLIKTIKWFWYIIEK